MELAISKKMAFCLLVALAPFTLPAQDGRPPANVRVAEARVQSLAPVMRVPATVASRSDARLAAEVAGRLIMVADVGTEVEAGDVVARIEDRALRLRHDELEAELARSEARVQFLEREEKRFAKLAESNLTAATQLEQTRSDRDVARGDMAVARSRLAQNEDRLARTQLKAPFPGVVVERLLTPGERVNEGGNIVRLVDQGNLEVVARAPLEYFAYVRQGMSLDLTTVNASYQGNVRTVVAVGDEETHQFEIRLDLENVRLPVGQTLRLSVPMSDRREVVAVPRDALVLRPEGISVFVVGADGQARQVSVTTGIGAGELIEVLGDIAPGDRVIVRGNERLQPGQTVNIMDQ